MTRTNKILGAALVVQIGLVAVTWGTRGSAPTSDAAQLIPDVEVGQVQRLRVEAPSGNAKTKTSDVVEVARKGDGWVVPGADDYPADTKKVENIVKSLLAGRVRAPIASNKSNHNALEVGERTFARKVDLGWDGGEAKLMIGSARGTSAHVRRVGEDKVYLARGFSASGIDKDAASYIDTTWLDVEEPDQIIVKNPRGTLTLNKSEGQWRLEEMPKGEVPDPERFTAFVGQARKLVIHSPVGKTVKDEYGLSTELAAHVTLKKGDKTWKYSLGALVDGNRYVKREDNDWVVRIPSFAVSNLMDQTAAGFVKEDRDAPAPGGPPGMPGMPGGLKLPGIPGLQ